ncbi:MAG: hypothetical protein C4560_09195 [Nitrospiraceae bacterium]|nr:MAG: hypothetical protein C4560_09195 [Nitrospiraceae bacterium]
MMIFRIADIFTDSLSKLTGEEQKAVKTTAFDLQLNPAIRVCSSTDEGITHFGVRDDEMLIVK